ncbi:hypothetical protein DIPPA_07112, partial [Diplonema papillatum]
PAGGRVWSGGADGVIRIFSADDLYQICQIEEPHNGAMVSNLTTLCRLNAIKGWYVSRDGTLKVVYSESDAPEDHVGAFSPNEEAMSKEIEKKRAITIQDYKDLDMKKSQLETIKNRAGRRKGLVMDVLNRMRNTLLKKRYWSKLSEWYQRSRNERKRIELAHIVSGTTGKLLACVYFRKLMKHGRSKRRVRQINIIATQMMKTTTSNLQICYYKKLKEWMQIEQRRTHRYQLVQCLMKGTVDGFRTMFFYKWQRFAFKQRQRHKRSIISGSLLGSTKRGLITAYYYKLVDYYRRETTSLSRKVLSRALVSSHTAGLRRLYYGKCLDFIRRSRQLKTQRLAAEQLLACAENGCRRKYIARARLWLSLRRRKAHEGKLEDLQSKVEDLQRNLRESRALSDDDIDHQTHEVSAEISTLESDVDALNVTIQGLASNKHDLEEDVRNVGKPSFAINDDEKLTPQAFKVLAHLKCHGVHCGDDLAAIHILHEKKKSQDPAALFNQGFKRFKDALQSVCARERVQCDLTADTWSVPHDLVSRLLDKKHLDTAHMGIKEMVIAADQTQYAKSTREVMAKIERGGASKQILGNQALFVDTVLKIHRRRIAKEIRALPPDERQQFAHSLSEDDVEEPSAIDELEEVAEGVHDSCPDDAVEEMAIDLKAVDWSPIEVVLAPDGWEAADEDVDCCVDCGKTHNSGAFCARCGKRGFPSCLKASLPKEVAPLFLEHLSEDGWVCPQCLVSLHQAGSSLKEEQNARGTRDHDPAVPPSLDPCSLLAALEEGPVKTAFLALFAQSAMQAQLAPVPAAPVTTEAVDPRRVTTWLEGLASGQGRQMILSEVKARYTYHLVPEHPHDAGSSLDYERRMHFSTLTALMPLAHSSPPVLQVLHQIMVRLEALRLKCLHSNGTEFQVSWETRFGSMDYADFTKAALIQAQKAMAELAKKADNKEEEKEPSLKRPRRRGSASPAGLPTAGLWAEVVKRSLPRKQDFGCPDQDRFRRDQEALLLAVQKCYKSTPAMLSVVSRAQRYAEEARRFRPTLSDEEAFLMWVNRR